MAGTILERELTAPPTIGVGFDVACKADDAEIRRLLRENPIPGSISLSLEREPDYFADAQWPGKTKQTIVARDQSRVICVGCCTTRKRYLNGEPRRVGYLSGLRLDARYAGRFDVLRRGYGFFRELQREAPADFYFTSIAEDNQRARSFLERGVRGMPRYQLAGEFVTVLIAAGCGRRKERLRRVAAFSSPDLNPPLNEYNRSYQFAPCWEEKEIAALQQHAGVQLEGFCFGHESNHVDVCVAIWDQRSYKQTVVRGYAGGLALVRPLFNIWARLTHQPQLPPINSVLANAFISHLAIRGGVNILRDLISELCVEASQHGIELLTLGFDANDPRLEMVRNHFRCREYRSRIYIVSWPRIGGAADELDGRCLAPEVSLL